MGLDYIRSPLVSVNASSKILDCDPVILWESPITINEPTKPLTFTFCPSLLPPTATRVLVEHDPRLRYTRSYGRYARHLRAIPRGTSAVTLLIFTATKGNRAFLVDRREKGNPSCSWKSKNGWTRAEGCWKEGRLRCRTGGNHTRLARVSRGQLSKKAAARPPRRASSWGD